MQQQDGASDCGLFAIAFAVHAALGDNVSQVTFDQPQMRKHSIKCFMNKKMLPFPTLKKYSLKNKKI